MRLIIISLSGKSGTMFVAVASAESTNNFALGAETGCNPMAACRDPERGCDSMSPGSIDGSGRFAPCTS